MKKRMRKSIVLGLGFIFLFLTAWAQTVEQPPSEKSITILWAEWKPSDYLQELTRDFTAKTGIKVIVKQVPWADFQKVFFDSMEKKEQTYDLVGGDSQWLGLSVTRGYFIELSQWIKDHGVDQTMTDASLKGYAQYPVQSGRFWAVPLEGDALGFAYRRDLFEDPREREAFKVKYGYELAIPENWNEFRDCAEFFTRPAKGLWGVSLYSQKKYDAITMGMDVFVWGWGADLGDFKTFKVKGILNSPEGVKGLEFYKKLYQFCPPNWDDTFFEKSNQAVISGKVAMAMNFFAFFPPLIDKKINPYASVTGFFVVPSGPKEKVSMLGGQGISVIAYSKKKEYSFDFLSWFIQKDVQERWAELGGYSCDKRVLQSEKFLKATPYNKAFMESMQVVRDFWTVPEYPDLLAVSQKYWNAYITSEQYSSQEVMDMIADEWEQIFEYAGYYKE